MPVASRNCSPVSATGFRCDRHSTLEVRPGGTSDQGDHHTCGSPRRDERGRGQIRPEETLPHGRGDPPTLLRRGASIAVVGSRRATQEGLQRARIPARALAHRGITVVSGLAVGIDRATHEAAIEAAGRTVAVLGTPLDEVYPKENRTLQERIGREHLLVSQFPSGHPVSPKNFPLRNRTMALLTDATVIVQAGEGSGVVYQGWEALRLGRPLFLLENVAMDRTLTWPAQMIRHGAQVLSRSSLPLVLDTLAPPRADATLAVDSTGSIDPAFSAI